MAHTCAQYFNTAAKVQIIFHTRKNFINFWHKITTFQPVGQKFDGIIEEIEYSFVSGTALVLYI